MYGFLDAKTKQKHNHYINTKKKRNNRLNHEILFVQQLNIKWFDQCNFLVKEIKKKKLTISQTHFASNSIRANQTYKIASREKKKKIYSRPTN